MIPVEVTQTPWHYTTFWDWLDHWQTLIAGVLAFAAGVGTVVVAMRVIAATREQTVTTVRLERERVASEASAFRAMLKAAMERVIAGADWARQISPHFFSEEEEVGVSSSEVHLVRECITKGGFAELRAACVKLGDPLTGEFLDLEREIDSFALQYAPGMYTLQKDQHAGLRERFSLIERAATALRDKAVERTS